MRKKSFANRIKFDLMEKKENGALRKIYGLDKKFQNKTFQNVQKHDDLIVHIRENRYGDRKVVQVDSDEKNKVSKNEEEENAYQKIKDTFGAEPVKIIKQEKGIKFLQMELDENLQVAEMMYQYSNSNYLYIISAGYYKSSF